MRARDLLAEAWGALGRSPRRAIAGSMGVFWGAAGIVVLLASGTGFREFMRSELQSFGPRVVVLVPALTSSGFRGHRAGVPVRLDRAAAEVAERLNPHSVEAVLAEHLSKSRMGVETPAGRERWMDLSASDERYAAYRGFEPEAGRFFTRADVEGARPVAMLGHDAAVELFGSSARAVGERVRIAGRPFAVVGVAKPKGRQYTDVNRPDNRLVIVPISTAEARLGFDERRISRLLVFPRAGVEGVAASRAVQRVLGPRGGFDPGDADALRLVDLSEPLGLVDIAYATFMIFIGIAGLFGLLVGGVGVANYQLAIVAERSGELAVMQALGARSSVIVRQIGLEALITALAAAGGGVTLGALVCWGIGALASPSFPRPIVSGTVAGVTAAALFGVALVASLIPAFRVRSIDVAAALRANL